MGLDLGYFPKRGKKAGSEFIKLGIFQALSLLLSYLRETGERGIEPGHSPVGVLGVTRLNAPLRLQGVPGWRFAVSWEVNPSSAPFGRAGPRQ